MAHDDHNLNVMVGSPHQEALGSSPMQLQPVFIPRSHPLAPSPMGGGGGGLPGAFGGGSGHCGMGLLPSAEGAFSPQPMMQPQHGSSSAAGAAAGAASLAATSADWAFLLRNVGSMLAARNGGAGSSDMMMLMQQQQQSQQDNASNSSGSHVAAGPQVGGDGQPPPGSPPFARGGGSSGGGGSAAAQQQAAVAAAYQQHQLLMSCSAAPAPALLMHHHQQQGDASSVGLLAANTGGSMLQLEASLGALSADALAGGAGANNDSGSFALLSSNPGLAAVMYGGADGVQTLYSNSSEGAAAAAAATAAAFNASAARAHSAAQGLLQQQAAMAAAAAGNAASLSNASLVGGSLSGLASSLSLSGLTNTCGEESLSGSLLRAGGSMGSMCMGGAAAALVSPKHMSASLYIKNLPLDADKLFLYEKFAPYGAILSIKVLCDPQSGQCRGVGFVNFAEHSAAMRSIQALHGIKVGDKLLHVSLQTPRLRAAALQAM